MLANRFYQLTYMAFTALQIGVLVSWSLYHGTIPSKLGIVASSMSLATALVMAALSYLEHERAVRPSTVLCVYLLLSVLFDAAQCRTLWLLHAQQHIPQRAMLPSFFTAQFAVKTSLLIMESLSKKRHLMGSWRALKRSPDALASVFNLGVFWWLNDLLVRGFRATLNLDTLYETDEALRSEGLLEAFRARITQSKPSKYRLPLAIARCLKLTLIKTVLARLFVIGFKFARPFLLQYIIEFVQNDQQGGKYHQDIAYSLIAATGLLYIGTAVCIVDTTLHGLCIDSGAYRHQTDSTITSSTGVLP